MNDQTTPANAAAAATPKNKRQMTFTVLDDKSVRADFGEGIDPFTFQPAALPDSIFPDAVAKGVIARLQSYSSSLQGDERTPTNLRARTVKGWEDLTKGIWVTEREAGAGEISIEAEAAHMFRVERAKAENKSYDLTLEQTAEIFAALPDGLAKDPAHGDAPTPGSKARVKATALYQSCYARVKAERALKKAEKLAKQAADDVNADDF